MATKRLTEATLRRIVREETRKLTEAPMGPPMGARTRRSRRVAHCRQLSLCDR
jgi:hypothetical protein